MRASKHANGEILPANLLDHRAVKAWRRIQPESFEPRNIEVLKLTKKKSAVYRLIGVGPNGSAVIAKRVRTETATVERTVYETVLTRVVDQIFWATFSWAAPPGTADPFRFLLK